MAQTTVVHSIQTVHEDLPWVVFRLQHVFYAVHSANIQGIMVMPDDLTEVPNMRNIFKGIMTKRDSVVPLLDLRRLFGMQSTDEEVFEFREMIEQRKQDCIDWANELRRCYEQGDAFTLTTDPHRCAFGQWYNHYTTDSLVLSHHLKKIEEPHQRLHAAASRMQNPSVTAADRKKLLEEVEELLSVIVTVLEESVSLFSSINRGMVILLAKEDASVGVVVDEVLAVQELDIITDIKSSRRQSEYILKVAKSDRIQGEILTLDDALILATSKDMA